MSNIIFIPGIKGTELFLDTNKKWFPKNLDDLKDLHIENDNLVVGNPINSVTAFTTFTVNIYKGIYDNFSVEDGEIDFFGYDWRKDIQTHVPALVDRIRDLSKKGKVTVVAHSMGGMLAKIAILKMDELGLMDCIENLITIGTPWGGSPDAFKALAYGEPGFYAEFKPIFGLLYSYGDTRKLARQCPSVYQLLPSESYYKDETGKFIKYRETKEDSQYMDVIQKVQTFFNEEYQENNPEFSVVPDVWHAYMKPVQEAMLKPMPLGLKHHCIVGHKFPTLCSLPDGTSEKYNKFKFKSDFTNGDAVVPLLSGIPQHEADLYYVKGEHGKLCSDEVVIKLLKSLLNEQLDALPKGVSKECNMKLKWELKTRLLCPIETTIMDSEGRYVAGAYDTDIVEQSPMLDETEVKYVSVGDSQYIFFEKFNEDLTIQINSYETGVADISAEYMDEDDKIIELEFDPLPVDRGLTALVTIPVKERIESANIQRRGSIVSNKRIKTIARVETVEKKLPDRANLKVSVATTEDSKKAYRRDVFNGQVLLTIDSTNDEILDRLFFSINNATPQEYTAPTILNLPSGIFELQAFGKDTFDRPIKTKTFKFTIDNAQPVTELSMISTPDGMIIDFEPHTVGSKVKDTFYKITVGSELIAEGVWDEEPLSLPWGILNIDSNAKITIEYNSISEFNVVEDLKSLEIALGNIPQLMWDENTGYVTPEIVLNNLLKYTSIDFNSFEIYANIKNTDNIKLNKNNPRLTLNEGIKDNVKSVRFISDLVSFEVMFLEKYGLYFIDFPTEKLKVGNSYTFSFELLPDRGDDPILNTNPQARIKSPKASKIPDKHLEIKLIDGRFYSSFHVDESFVQFKNKLVITDVKNTHPPLRESTLITKEE
ncbi:alpha/beta hydrolase [Paenibacillus sp. W2I17]|uniref:lipase/acyltransferase domain-containing protein n=1 Tax=Paenibacillus sp. W2I17 TaxID=3042311 RepID=UPI002783D7E8|nr:alpha/beta hydrolase [Paenibacillus sp. W2I17]MDQ0658735.1 hypothetical protein [Paenibacillus sp. W2I17]